MQVMWLIKLLKSHDIHCLQTGEGYFTATCNRVNLDLKKQINMRLHLPGVLDLS